jgi:pleiotropic regulator 1
MRGAHSPAGDIGDETSPTAKKKYKIWLRPTFFLFRFLLTNPLCRISRLRSAALRMNVKLSAEYGFVKDMPNPTPGAGAGGPVVGAVAAGAAGASGGAGPSSSAGGAPLMLTDGSAAPAAAPTTAAERLAGPPSTAVVSVGAGAGANKGTHIMPRRHQQASLPKPEWHAPWKMMRVISGHLGWVRCIAVDPTNEWFVTGSADRTIKVWDLASGTLKLTLTGHISTVRGLAVSARSPYLFSAGEDKMVKCWDLEYNKVIRHYHGHLSGVYSLSLHPTLDLLVTGGRDSVARVWDVRTKNNVHTLTGHTQTVSGLATQSHEPQVVTGSMDGTIRLWDLVAGRASAVLTNHKKAVRSVAISPSEHTFVSASADNMKKWKNPEGRFLHNITGHNCIVHDLAINEDGVMASGGDTGNLHLWDYKTGYNFQTLETIAQPGSLESERAIYACAFDQSGSRLITGEADKTIKMWKEDPAATQESHPVSWDPPRDRKKY